MIRSKKTFVAGVLTAGLALSGAGLVGAQAATAAPKPQVIDCAGKGVVKPKEIVIACADAGVMVNKIDWTKWTANTASGRGTLTWNTCLPETCVDGIVEEYKVRVNLSGLASAPKQRDVFSRMTLTFIDGGPALAERSIYTLSNERR